VIGRVRWIAAGIGGWYFISHITAAQRAIRLLQEKHIISQTDESQWGKVFCATDIGLEHFGLSAAEDNHNLHV
jgi:hypothetical protein